MPILNIFDSLGLVHCHHTTLGENTSLILTIRTAYQQTSSPVIRPMGTYTRSSSPVSSRWQSQRQRGWSWVSLLGLMVHLTAVIAYTALFLIYQPQLYESTAIASLQPHEIRIQFALHPNDCLETNK